MKPITDAEVAELPLDRGQAQLLEAIMSTPTLEPVTGPAPRQLSTRRRTATVVAVAAASVAAIATAPLWLDRDQPEPTPAPGVSGSSEESEAPIDLPTEGDGRLYPGLHDLPDGWEVDGAGVRPIVSIAAMRLIPEGGLTFSVEVREAEEYDSIVEGQTTQGGERAGTIGVDGRTAQVWELTESEGSGKAQCDVCVHHWSAITPVEDGHFVHVVATGLVEGTLAPEEWERLVASIDFVPAEEFGAVIDGLPEQQPPPTTTRR
ncbi:hypothetical protein HNR19_003696 [Nocardioides thalensis]|uniref:Uncharacterized protein n=1 Tax=Nocardioides thalensis TaxID=1914755 RepID=A0A853C980_9ACTN|nr:hypothetical protein [Nocardioides thalensis]NYJ02998.1 hypothetical protein [Nocardioides thalensis]